MNNTPTDTPTGLDSPTPRTDAAEKQLDGIIQQYYNGLIHPRDLAGFLHGAVEPFAQLERETATLHAQLGEANLSRDALRNEFDRREGVLNSLRAQIARLKQREGELVGALRWLVDEAGDCLEVEAPSGLFKARAALQSVAKEGEQ